MGIMQPYLRGVPETASNGRGYAFDQEASACVCTLTAGVWTVLQRTSSEILCGHLMNVQDSLLDSPNGFPAICTAKTAWGLVKMSAFSTCSACARMPFCYIALQQIQPKQTNAAN